jgi:hypothetical protein
MSESINNGGPAFPINNQHGCIYSGMTLRDWFAGQALQAIISKHPPKSQVMTGVNELDMQTARGAYDYADAMLKVREVKP